MAAVPGNHFFGHCDQNMQIIYRIKSNHRKRNLQRIKRLRACHRNIPIQVKVCNPSSPKAQEIHTVRYWLGETGACPVCPNCTITLEREYQSYCDRCGQKLAWHKYHRGNVTSIRMLIAVPRKSVSEKKLITTGRN